MDDGSREDKPAPKPGTSYAPGIGKSLLIERYAACFPEFHFSVQARVKVELTPTNLRDFDLSPDDKTQFIFWVEKTPTGIASRFRPDGDFGSRFLSPYSVILDTVDLAYSIDRMEEIVNDPTLDFVNLRNSQTQNWPFDEDGTHCYDVALKAWNNIDPRSQQLIIDSHRLEDELWELNFHQSLSVLTVAASAGFASSMALNVFGQACPETFGSYNEAHRQLLESSLDDNLTTAVRSDAQQKYDAALLDLLEQIIDASHDNNSPWLGQDQGHTHPYGMMTSIATLARILDMNEQTIEEQVHALAAAGRVFLTHNGDHVLPSTWHPDPEIIAALSSRDILVRCFHPDSQSHVEASGAIPKTMGQPFLYNDTFNAIVGALETVETNRELVTPANDDQFFRALKKFVLNDHDERDNEIGPDDFGLDGP